MSDDLRHSADLGLDSNVTVAARPIVSEIDMSVQIVKVPQERRVVGEHTDGVVVDAHRALQILNHHAPPRGVAQSPVQTTHDFLCERRGAHYRSLLQVGNRLGYVCGVSKQARQHAQEAELRLAVVGAVVAGDLVLGFPQCVRRHCQAMLVESFGGDAGKILLQRRPRCDDQIHPDKTVSLGLDVTRVRGHLPRTSHDGPQLHRPCCEALSMAGVTGGILHLHIAAAKCRAGTQQTQHQSLTHAGK